MIRIVCALTLLALLGTQESRVKVDELVEKLGSEEVAVREAAQAELLKAGPAVLPALRTHHAAAAGERKERLRALIVKLERVERLARFMSPGPTVTLKCKDRPAAEVLGDVSRQAGVPVDGTALPAGTLLSVDADRLSFSAVIDELCSRHGNIVARWSATRVCLVPGPYRKRPTFEAGSFRFIPDGFLWTMNRGDTSGLFSLQGVLIGSPDRPPHGACLEIDEARDDRGNDLGTDFPTNFWVGESEFPGDDPPRFCRRIWTQFDQAPHRDAGKLTECRGKLRLTFVLEGRRAISVKAKATPGIPFFDAENRLAVTRTRLDGRLFTVAFTAFLPGELDGPTRPPTWLALHDAKGRKLDGHFRERPMSLIGAGLCSVGEVSFMLPDGFEADTLDLMEATDFEIVRIPFDLAGVPLR